MKSNKLEEAWEKTGYVASPDPALYLDTVSVTSFARDYKRRTFSMLAPRPGTRFLDVGCGTGDDVLELARLVDKRGKVVGIDRNPAMISQSVERARNSGLPVSFEIGDAHALRFANHYFDGVRSDRAVQHMENPEKVIQEMSRVTVPGGRVVITEPDWETLAVDSSDRAVTRRVVQFISDRGVRHGWIGRQLASLFRRAGLDPVESSGDTFIIRDFKLADRVWGLSRHSAGAQEAGYITAAERVAWLAELQTADAAGLFFSAMVGFAASGVKP
jgi:ubiquinone/menaquinone biosynthesis C-methylase UbiE